MISTKSFPLDFIAKIVPNTCEANLVRLLNPGTNFFNHIITLKKILNDFTNTKKKY